MKQMFRLPALALALVPGVIALTGLPAAAAPAVSTISVQGTVTDVAVDPNTHTVYVASQGSSLTQGYVTEIDGQTGAVTNTIPLGCAPAAIGVNPNTDTVYALTNVGDACGGSISTLFAIDGKTGLTDTTYSIPYAAPHLVVDSANNNVYVPNENKGLVAIDATTGATQTIGLGMYAIEGMAVNPTTDTIYVGGDLCVFVPSFICNSTVVTIDGATNTPTVNIGLATSYVSPASIAVDPTTGNTYVAYGPDVLVLDATGLVTHTIPVAGSGTVLGVAVDPAGGTVYAADDNVVTVIDAATGAVTGTITAGSGPVRLAVDPNTHNVFVMDSVPGSISMIGTAAKDAVPPVVTVSTSATPDAATGWYNVASSGTNGITINVSAVDATDGVTGISCTDSNPLNVVFRTTQASGSFVLKDGIHSIICSATDKAGNTGSNAMPGLYQIDQTPPAITFADNFTPYQVDQTVSIFCNATDNLSAVATTSCLRDGGTVMLASGPAYNFTIGTNTVTATATDKAGNQTTQSTTFTVVDTVTGVQNLIIQFTDPNNSYPPQVGSLLTQVNSIGSAPNAQAKAGKVQAFINHVNAQTGPGKLFTPAQAQVLSRLAAEL